MRGIEDDRDFGMAQELATTLGQARLERQDHKRAPQIMADARALGRRMKRSKAFGTASVQHLTVLLARCSLSSWHLGATHVS